MNTQNFKIVEVAAFNKQEATTNAAENNGIQVIKDATQAWKNAGKPITERELRKFCAEYLQQYTKFASGVGCSITIESGVADTRERPYTLSDIKNEKGKRKYKTGIQGIDKETGEILFTCFTNKSDAKDMAKELYTKHDYKGDIHAVYCKVVVEGETGAFDVVYTPSKSSKVGKYLVFGVER